MGVGMVYLRQGNAPAAMPPLEQGLQVCHTFGFTALMFHGIAASLGAAYALANRTAEAIPLLRKVADQAASMKLVSDHLLGAIPLGEVALATGQIEEAAQLGRPRARPGSAAQAARPRGLRPPPPRRGGRAPRSLRRGKQPRSTTGARWRWLDELGMRPLIAHCHLGLGKLYRRTGDPRGPRST